MSGSLSTISRILRIIVWHRNHLLPIPQVEISQIGREDPSGTPDHLFEESPDSGDNDSKMGDVGTQQFENEEWWLAPEDESGTGSDKQVQYPLQLFQPKDFLILGVLVSHLKETVKKESYSKLYERAKPLEASPTRKKMLKS
ncbi:hypothetical protein FKM82_007134 [Ascaphus truei]